jgi:hypothetical protein
VTGAEAIAEDAGETDQQVLLQRSAAIIAGIEAIDPDHVLHLASSTLKASRSRPASSWRAPARF